MKIECQPTRKLTRTPDSKIENSCEAGPLELARSLYRSTLEDKILAALKRGRLSTRDLADALGEPVSRISYYCRKLKLKSDLEQGPKLLFCVDEQQVVGSGTYEACKEEEHELRFFYAKVRVWRLDASERA